MNQATPQAEACFSFKRTEGDYMYGGERERTFNRYNMRILEGAELSKDGLEMPIIRKEATDIQGLIGFNYCKSRTDKSKFVHFFLDDYQFERVWNTPERYLSVFERFGGILTPDFSCYLDMNRNQQIYNVYRSRAVGAYYQRQGIKVIPTITWGGADTYSFAFSGIEKGSVVAVSTVGVVRRPLPRHLFNRGVEELIRRIEPECIYIHGKNIGGNYGSTKVVYFENESSRW